MTKRTLRVVHYAENDSDDDDTFLTIKRKRKRSRLANTKHRNNSKSCNGNSNDDGLNRNNCSRDNGQQSNDDVYGKSQRHPQVNANLRKRKNISHRRSLCSLGLEEDGTSCDEDDEDIGALATSQRRRSSSRDSFPNMLLRRSSRTKKTRYKTLNLRTIEDAVMLEQVPESPQPEVRRSRDRSIKPELRDLLLAQGKSPNDAESLQPPDIYSSIKSRQRQPKKFFNDDFRDPTEPILPDIDEIPDTVETELLQNDPLKENSILQKENEEVKIEKEEEKEQNHVIERDKSEEQEEKEKVETEETEEEEEEEESDEESDESDSDDIHRVTRRYSLRKKRVQPSRLVDEMKRQTRRSTSGIFARESATRTRRKRHKKVFQQNTASPYQQRERITYSQEASTTSSSSANEADDDERKFAKRKEKSMNKARNRCLPMNLSLDDLNSHGFTNERRKIGSSLADVDPMNIDRTVRFDSIGGHKKHVRSLKEMVVFPLMYPEVFQKFHINPPRGCLFYGPPGTGKTLMARALANECSTEGRKVAFFMRKGADCLSKWVGESERQLRLLFDQAYQMRPSIIFFDEIDGLAPVRSSRQDQIHSSIVSTLLGLMDGLDNRGEIIVIGATNRIDSIDPALRRPGRFDREFAFALPDKKARKQILSIHTRKWIPPLTVDFLEDMAEKTSGYCGADIMALCAESTLFALRRRYPQIYASSDKLKLNVDEINVTVSDFNKAMQNIVPTAQRSASNPARNLSPVLRPLLVSTLQRAITQLAKLFPLIKRKSKLLRSSDPESSHMSASSESESEFEEEEGNRSTRLALPLNGISLPSIPVSNLAFRGSKIHRPRMLICGEKGDGHTSHLAPAVLYDLEGVPVHVLDLPVLYATSTRVPEEACAQIFREALRTAPSIVYMPHIFTWWKSTTSTVHQMFKSLIKSVSPTTPVLIIATANCSFNRLPRKLREAFRPHNTKILSMTSPSYEERITFFSSIFLQLASRKPVNKQRKKQRRLEVLEKVTTPASTQLTEKELEKIESQEEATMTNLRLFLRDVLTRIARDRRFKVFLQPVDIEEVPDYAEVVTEPMDLSTMMGKIDRHIYCNVQSFTCDINLICANALEYNPEHHAEDRAIRHRACLLRDMTHAIIQNELEPGFEKLCNDVIEARKKRNADPLKFAPAKFTTPVNRRFAQAQNSSSSSSKKKCIDSSQSPYFDLPPKRKRSAWASGIIKKYSKKKADLSEESGKDDSRMASEEDESVSVEVDDSAQDKEPNTVSKEEEHPPSGEAHDMEVQEQNEDDCALDLKQEENALDSVEEVESQEQNDISVNTSGMSLEVNSLSLPKTPPDSSACEEESVKDSAGYPSSDNESQSLVSNREEEEVGEVAASPTSHGCSGSPGSTSEVHSMEIKQEFEVKEECIDFGPAEKDIDDITCTINPCSSPAQCSSMQESISSPDLILDEQELKRLLYYTVEKTSSLRVEDLENLYSVLVRCIYRHHKNYDKTNMLKELAEEVEEFMKFFADDSSNDSLSS